MKWFVVQLETLNKREKKIKTVPHIFYGSVEVYIRQ